MPDLTKRNTRTHKDLLPHNPAPNKKSLQPLLLTGTHHPTRTLLERIPGYGMRPRHNKEPNAWPHPQADRRSTPPLPMIYRVKHREQSAAKDMGDQNGAKRSGGEGAPKSVRPPPLHRRQRPPPIKPTILEATRKHIDIETSPAPTKYCQHMATHRDPHHTHTLLESPLLPGTQPPALSTHSPTILILHGNLQRIVAAPYPRSRGQRTTMRHSAPIPPSTPVHSTFPHTPAHLSPQIAAN